MSTCLLRQALAALVMLPLTCMLNTSSTSAQTLTFQARREFIAGRNPSDILAHDLNRDGRLDLITTNTTADTLAVLLGTGDGTFQPARTTPVGNAPRALAVGDLDRDGHLDVAVAHRNSTALHLLFGNGDGTFRSVPPLTLSAQPADAPGSLVLADFNNDNLLDLAVAYHDGNRIGIMRGLGNGAFQGELTHATGAGSGPAALCAADFNNDSRTDLAVANFGSNTVATLLGQGNGSFTTAATVLVGTDPIGLVAAQFDNNTRLDLAVVNHAGQTVSILLGQGNGAFQVLAPALSIGPNAKAVAAGDFNGDGRQDVAAISYNNDNVAVFLGNGAGGFQSLGAFNTGKTPQSLTAGDFNGDGRTDLAAARENVLTVAVLLSTASGRPQVASNLSLTAQRATTGDFNGDNQADLVIANRTTGIVSVLLNQGSGAFETRTAGNGTDIQALATGDVNADFRTDLIILNGNSVALLLGHGNGSFQTARTYPVGLNPVELTTGYFNDDDFLDLAVANRSSDNLTILLGAQDGQLRAASLMPPVNGSPRTLEAAYFDEDEFMDLVVGNAPGRGGAAVVWLRGLGDGTFNSPVTLPAPNNETLALAVHDFDNDQAPDIAIVSSGRPDGTVLYGNGRGSFTLGPGFILPFDLSTFSVTRLLAADLNRDGLPDLALANGENLRNDNLHSVSVWANQGNRSFAPALLFGVDGHAFTLASGDFNRDGRPDLAVPFAGERTADNAIALLFNLLSGPATATIADQRLSGGPIPSGCAPPVPKNSFAPTDARAFQWLSFNGIVWGDVIRWEFIQPNGNIYRIGEAFFSFSGGGCAWGSLSIAGTPASELLGVWQVRVFYNNVPILTENFTIGGGSATPVLSAQPSALDFGSVTPGQAAERQFTVRNNGTATLNVSHITSNNARFTLASTTSFSLAPGGQQAVTVRFSPLTAGLQTGTLSLTSNDPVQPTATVQLTGTGASTAAPALDVQPASLDFGSVNVGASADRILTLRNTGDAALNVSNLTSNNARFSLTSAASFSIAAGGQQTVTVRFSPNAAGAQTGALTIASNDPARSSVTVPLAGTGAETPTGRLVRVGAASGAPGGTVAVPLELVAQGDENALGFSLNFDASVLSNPQAALGSDAGGAALNTNVAQLSQGRLGLALALPSGQRFAAGTRQIAVVTFSIAASTSASSTNLSFGDQPIAREISNTTANPLTASYLGGAVTLTTGYEADVAPRPQGNGAVTIADWVQVGRLAAGLDEAAGSEFQRADCAPLASKGDGRLSISDWVQAGRYAAGLDEWMTTGGPAAPVNLHLAELVDHAVAGPRTLRVLAANLPRGQSGTVMLELDAQGNENALGFSLNFDPAQLRFVGAAVGSGASGATLNINTNPAAQGRLGLALALPAGQSFPAGLRQVIALTFAALSNSSDSQTTLSFSDQPIAREVVDTSATALATAYTNGQVTLSGGTSTLAAVSGASFSLGPLASETIVAVFGNNLATSVQTATALPLPTTLAGTTVRVRDSAGVERLAQLFFVAPTQVNLLLPANLASGTATLTVTSGDGRVATGAVEIAPVAPGIFTANANGQGLPAAVLVRVRADGSQSFEPLTNTPVDLGPEPDQLFLILFGTGWRGHSGLAHVSCTLGGVNAEVLFAGAQGDLAGLDQLNLRLPRALAGRGEVTLALTVDGRVANTVRLAVR